MGPNLDGIDRGAHRRRSCWHPGRRAGQRRYALRLAAWWRRTATSCAGDAAARLSLEERAQRIGYVPQQSGLDAPLPVRDVVGQARYAHGAWCRKPTADDQRAVDEAMIAVDVQHLADARFSPRSRTAKAACACSRRALATSAPVTPAG